MYNELLKILKDTGNYYLPFSTKEFGTADAIIEDFLSVLSEKTSNNAQGIYCFAPTFYFLKNYNNWQIEPFSHVNVLSRFDEEDLNRLYSVEDNWNGVNKLLENITRYLNEENGRNGRLILIINTTTCKKVQIVYTEDEQTITFNIPELLHQKWLEYFEISDINEKFIKTISQSKFKKPFNLKKKLIDVNFQNDSIILPLFEDADCDANVKHNSKVYSLIKECFYMIIKHSVYITSQSALVYIFSNNVELNDNNRDAGLGGIFLLIDKRIISSINQSEGKIIEQLIKLTDALSSRLINFYYIHELKNSSRKAAISQVMARNMSHNIGSHVLSRMVTDETIVNSFFKSGNKDLLYKSILPHSEPNNAVSLFNSYMRNRMDFLADIATNVPVMEVTKMLLTDVVSGIDRNLMLLHYISGSDKFRYRLQLFDGRGSNSDKPNLIDIPVSVPNDVLGFHAFYIIIENVIRNTAKHGESEDVTFSIEIKDCPVDNTLYEVWISDDSKKIGKYSLKDDDRDLYKAKINHSEAPKEMNLIDWLVFKQNCYINDEILDNSSSLRQGAWGIIEMKVSAAYLRKIAPEYIDDQKYKLLFKNNTDKIDGCFNELVEDGKEVKIPYILKATNKNNCLAYIFHLMKPKEILVVDEKGDLYDYLSKGNQANRTRLRKLNEFGIHILHTNEGKGMIDKFDDGANYPYPFMIVIPKGDFDEEKYFKKKGFRKGNLPNRIIKIGKIQDEHESGWIANSNDQIIHLIRSDEEVKSIINLVWKIWIEKRMNHFKIGSITTDMVRLNDMVGLNINDNGFIEYFNESVNINKNYSGSAFNFWIDHHGGEFTSKVCDNNFFDHYEAYSSSVKTTVDKCLKPGGDVVELCKIIEGALTRIVIVDERIQQAYQNDFSSINIKKEILQRASNVLIPSVNRLDLNKSVYKDENGEKFEDILFTEIRNISRQGTKIKGIDFIVIHLGVIEKILTAEGKGKEREDVKLFIERLITSTDSTAKIIITSGRGKPHNLPAEIPFISYSAVSQYAVETPFKSFLNQAAQSARIAV